MRRQPSDTIPRPDMERVDGLNTIHDINVIYESHFCMSNYQLLKLFKLYENNL